MNSELIQNALVALIVLGAASFLVRQRVRARRKLTPYCGDCPRCAAGASQTEPALVNIGRRRDGRPTDIPGPGA